jgi:hypothetical protein
VAVVGSVSRDLEELIVGRHTVVVVTASCYSHCIARAWAATPPKEWGYEALG